MQRELKEVHGLVSRHRSGGSCYLWIAIRREGQCTEAENLQQTFTGTV